MSTLIVMQRTLDAALPISMQHFAGTAVGAALGAATETYFHNSVLAFGTAVLVIGLLGVMLQVERSAFRYAGITLVIVMLVPRSTSAPLVALHRFFEVSIGLAVGLAIFALWPRIVLGFSAKQIQPRNVPLEANPAVTCRMASDRTRIAATMVPQPVSDRSVPTSNEVPVRSPSGVAKKHCIS